MDNYNIRVDGGSLFLFFLMAVLIIALVVFFLYCLWKLFVKAGKPGWASLISGHNTVLLLEIIGRPGWWFFLFLIPVVNIVLMVMLAFDLVKVFGKDTGFGCLLILFPYVIIPILALGDAKYLGPIDYQTVPTAAPAAPAKK